MTLLSPFVPLLFQGEEWGASTPFLYFTDHQDPELGRLVAEGRSKEFSAFRWQGAVPNPQERTTFERSKLDWSELSQPNHAELFDWYRRLIRLKKDRPEMPRESRVDAPAPKVKFDEAAQWLTFVHNRVLVVLNWSTRAQGVPMPAGEWKLVMRSDSDQLLESGGNAASNDIHLHRRWLANEFSGLRQFIENVWQTSIVERLQAYVRIPNKSPAFDPEWERHGYMDQAVELMAEWCRAQPVPRMSVEVRRLTGHDAAIAAGYSG